MSTMIHLVKATNYPIVMYRWESWTVKKAERIDAFELWCWRRFLRVPRTARISNQSILMEFSPEYSLERLMLKLKLHYFGHLMRRTDAFELRCWKRLFESPLDGKEIQPVYPKGDQSWVFIGRTDVEAETPVLWPPDVKS